MGTASSKADDQRRKRAEHAAAVAKLQRQANGMSVSPEKPTIMFEKLAPGSLSRLKPMKRKPAVSCSGCGGCSGKRAISKHDVSVPRPRLKRPKALIVQVGGQNFTQACDRGRASPDGRGRASPGQSHPQSDPPAGTNRNVEALIPAVHETTPCEHSWRKLSPTPPPPIPPRKFCEPIKRSSSGGTAVSQTPATKSTVWVGSSKLGGAEEGEEDARVSADARSRLAITTGTDHELLPTPVPGGAPALMPSVISLAGGRAPRLRPLPGVRGPRLPPLPPLVTPAR
jgi:hypothetical protein